MGDDIPVVDSDAMPNGPKSHPLTARVVLGGLLAIALVGGGFALGRTTVADDGSSDVVVTPNRAAHSSGSLSSAPLTSPGIASGDTSSWGGTFSGGGFMGGSGPLQRVLVRKTGEGIELRAYLQSSDQATQSQTVQCPTGQWCPPPDCFPKEWFGIEASNANAVGTWSMPADGSPATSLALISTYSFGDAEGDPVTVFAARATGQVAKVTVKLGNHADSMAPVNGWVALAVPVSTSSGPTDGTITGYGADGTQVAQVSTNELGSGFVPPPGCQPPAPPPPVLPDPDGPPPVDQDAAKAAIEDAYHRVYGGGEFLDFVEGGDQLQATSDAVKATNPVPPGIGSAVHEIRFINDHRAALIWDLLSDGNPLLSNQIGFAVLVDGKWKVARETHCGLLAMGKVQCPPG
ncbi:MAG TPA: hypothetical protein VGA11_00090 [Acidimicrobiia bacterium]